MGILDKLKRKQTAIPNVKSDTELLLEITASISYDDSTVIAEMKECISDTKEYFKKHCEHYEARGIKNAENTDMILWFTMVDILIHQGYVCELNWKCGKEGFVYFIKKNTLVQSEALPIEQEWLSDEGNITEWCHILDKKWSTLGICIAAIEIEGWNYIIFPVEIQTLQVLQENAERIGHRIYEC